MAKPTKQKNNRSTSPTGSATTNALGKFIGISLFIALAVWVVFGQTLRHDFFNYDDPLYVYQNANVIHGLTADGIRWAFTSSYADNWHPLTWASHMLDCQLYGLKAGSHHLTSVLLHTATALLLFLFLRQTTGSLWRSGFVAAVFAIHPLRVESVAWVAERKDVLSGFFFMATLLAYARYAAKPSAKHYLATALLFALGLMSKPMLVTLPLILLLLDFWPFKRTAGWPKLLVEKIPLFVMAGLSCVATLFAQRQALGSLENVPLGFRLQNAALSGLTYLEQTFYPAKLAVLYPLAPGELTALNVGLALAVLLTISIAALLLRLRFPSLLVGWCWYLVMLIPVIGIVQVGLQSHADRYTYLPQIGVLLAVTWGATAILDAWPKAKPAVVFFGITVALALVVQAREQTGYWRNSETLWQRTIACTTSNDVAHYNLGSFLYDAGRTDEAIQHFKTCLEIKPDDAKAHNNLGNALIQKGLLDEAISEYQRSLSVRPNEADTHSNLGAALVRANRIEEAIAHYRQALALQPQLAHVHFNLANALLQAGNNPEALAELERTVEMQPAYADACDSLAIMLANNSVPQRRDLVKALELAQRADRLSGGAKAEYVCTLAAVHAERGEFSQALEQVNRARRLATAQGNTSLLADIQTQDDAYRAARKPWTSALPASR